MCGTLLLLAACNSRTIELPAPADVGAAPSEPSAGGGGPGGTINEQECAPGRLARKAVWLSDVQFANSVAALLGADALPAQSIPDPALKPFSQGGIVVSASMLRSRLDSAEAATTRASGQVAALSGCGATDDACAQAFIADFAHRAFRRAVTREELADLNDVYAIGREASLEEGIQLATEAIIASPSFSYRMEFGGSVVDAATGARALGGDELASLLSFWLTDAPPDELLRAAAESGALDQPGEVERQVERLLSSESAQESITLTMMAAWGVSNIFAAAKDPSRFPEYGPLLQSSMFEETRLFLDSTLWPQGSTVDQVLTSRHTFVNRSLADLYGVPFPSATPAQFVPVELPANERAGLLTQASLLAARARAAESSVVSRGLFMHGALLCFEGPPPPPEESIAELQEMLDSDMNERERAEIRATTSPCVTCHSRFDGFGLMFENYDAIGRYRTELDGVPIDASASVSAVGYEEVFDNILDFVVAAADDPQFTACLARHLAAYATSEDGTKTDYCELAELASTPPGEVTLSEIALSLAKSPLLTTRSGE